MIRRDVVVIGASAGGVEALTALMHGLPPDFPAAVLVVLHVPPNGGSVLPSILDRAGPLPVRHPTHEEPLIPGTVLVAPPDHHLVLRDDHVTLTRGPRENGHRPAVDVLFRSAARAVGPRAIGVVLSGVLDDGTVGLNAIVSRGGMAVVQDPADAMYPGMPESALKAISADHVAPAAAIGELLTRLVGERQPVAISAPSATLEIEADLALMDEEAMNQDERPGRPSGFSCPDCAGVLWEIRENDLVHYRCRVGHAWSAESLLGEQTEQLDGALWMALRSLEEKAALSRRLWEAADQRGSALTARRFAEQLEDATHAANLIRSLLDSHIGSAGEEGRRG